MNHPDFTKMSEEELRRYFNGTPIPKYGDPILAKHAESVRILKTKYPDRDWKYNLSPEQIEEIKKVTSLR